MPVPVPLERPRYTLRLKLTLWFVLVFVGLQVLLFASIAWLRGGALERSFDADLGHSAEVMVENLLVSEGAWLDEPLDIFVPADSGFAACAVRDAEGDFVASSDAGADVELPFTSWERVVAGPLGPVFSDLPGTPGASASEGGGAGALRVITLPFRDATETGYYLQAAVPVAPLERALGPLRESLLYGLPVGLLAACGAAWWIGRRAVAPIVQLSQAAQAIEAEGRGDRIRAGARDAEASALEDELNRALERYGRAARSREEFAAYVSHELKTPIAVLLTQLELVRGDEDAEESARFLAEMETELRALARTVDSLLALSRVDEDGLGRRARRIALNDLVVEAVENGSLHAAEREIRLITSLATSSDGEDPPTVVADPDLLRTAIENLVRNAVRFSPPRRTVHVRVHAEEGRNSVVVRDFGPGIPGGESILDRTGRAPRRPGLQGGTGLGLSIVQKIVRAHGGTVTARNERGGGSSFAIHLDAAPADADLRPTSAVDAVRNAAADAASGALRRT